MSGYHPVDLAAALEALEIGWDLLQQLQQRDEYDPETLRRWNHHIDVIRTEFDAGAVIGVLVDMALISYRHDGVGVERNLASIRAQVTEHLDTYSRPADPRTCPAIIPEGSRT